MINGLGDERVGSRRHGAHQFTPVSKQERSFSATMHTIAASIVQRSMARGACTNPGERARWLHAPGADHMHACDDQRTMQMCVDTLGFFKAQARYYDSIDSMLRQQSCSGSCISERVFAHLAAWGLYRGVLGQSSDPPARADSRDRAIGPRTDAPISSCEYYSPILP